MKDVSERMLAAAVQHKSFCRQANDGDNIPQLVFFHGILA